MQFLSGQGESWLELGVGNGRLADACLQKLEPASYVGVEKDRSLIETCLVSPSSRFVLADVLDPKRLSQILGNKLYSRVAGNPPYGCTALPVAAQNRFEALCPGLQLVNGWGHLDLYFVLESLARLQRPGQAGFIVSAALAEDVRLTAFRKVLIETASEVQCYALPADSFGNKAEVQSYILIARFGRVKQRAIVKVGRLAGEDFSIAEERSISADAAIARLDLGYHKFVELNTSLQARTGSVTMRELGATIIRGSRSHHQFVDMGVPHFHTSDFPRDGGDIKFDHARASQFQLACEGDILVPRVGTRCLDRHAVVVTGSRPYTEAVYRLRVPGKQVDRIAAWIGSDAGTVWRTAAAKGACAKHLTVAALMQMPIP